jgi:hypothetical protein
VSGRGGWLDLAHLFSAISPHERFNLGRSAAEKAEKQHESLSPLDFRSWHRLCTNGAKRAFARRRRKVRVGEQGVQT